MVYLPEILPSSLKQRCSLTLGKVFFLIRPASLNAINVPFDSFLGRFVSLIDERSDEVRLSRIGKVSSFAAGSLLLNQNVA